LCAGPAANGVFVQDRQGCVDSRRQDQPVDRYVFCEDEPQNRDGGGHHRQLRVAEPDVLALLSRYRRDMNFEAFRVFLAWIKQTYAPEQPA